jgi:hypothetical protein
MPTNVTVGIQELGCPEVKAVYSVSDWHVKGENR